MLRPILRSIACALWLSAASAQASPEQFAELEQKLAEEARLSWVEQLTLARYPALAEADARRAALAERVSGAARFPDPEFKYEQWAVPLSAPYALNRADTLMFGLRQAFPAPGARAARERLAGEEHEIATAQRKVLTRDVLLRVRRAYFDYYAADRVLRVHLEHVSIAEQIVNQVKSEYEIGRGSQQDVLKVLLELSRLHNDLAEVKQQRESSRFLLNALMARDPDAPLGPPVEIDRPAAAPTSAELERERAQGRPELAAAERAIRRAEAALDAAKIAARRPSFMLAADYWLMPTQDMPHAYGAMVSMSLPWLSKGRRADVREAEQVVTAERHAAETAQTLTRFELHDALARLGAANSSLDVIESSVLPQADKSLSATKSAFALGQASLLSLLDSLRAYFQIRLEHTRALSRVMSELASLEFASGSALLSAQAKAARP